MQNEINQDAIPENVIIAINAILSPYKVTLKSLTHPSPQTDEIRCRYLSLEEASTYCSLSRWTIARLIKAKKLKKIKISDTQQGKALVDIRDLDRYLCSLKGRAK